MATIKEITKNTAYIGTLKIFSMIVGLLTNVVVVRALGPADFGVYSLILYLAGAIAVFANLGLDQALPRYVAELKVKGNYGMIHTLVNISLKYRLVILIVLSLILFALSEPIARFLNNQDIENYLKIAGIVLIPQILLTIFNSAYSGLQDFRYITKIGMLFSFLNFVFIVIAIKIGLRITGMLAAIFLSSSIILVIYFYNFSRNIPKNTRTEDVSIMDRIRKFTIYSTAIGVIDYIVWNRSGVFFVELFGTSADAGYFSIAYSLPTLIFLNIPFIFFSVFFPSFSEMYASTGYTKIKDILPKGMKIISILITPIFIFCIIFAQYIIDILYGSAYAPAVLPFRLLMISTYISNVLLLASVSLYASERIDVNLKTDFIALISIISLNIAFVPSYGIVGAALIFAIIQSITIITQTLILSKISYTKIPAAALIKILILNIVIIFPFLFYTNNSIISLFISAVLYYTLIFFITTKIMLSDDEKIYFKGFPMLYRIVNLVNHF